ncbi:MAG: helix-turn-helix domain-containing protein [Deltaproteobacteria bacterium]|nr:helix-turn-helix domain-containing protein [Deltaproteobacteria bacterium]
MLENVGPDTKRRRENAARPRPIDPEFLTVDELAEVLRSSEITIRRLIRNDAIPRAFVGGKWLFPRALIRDVWVQDPVLAMRLWRDEPARHVAGRGGRAEVPTPRAKTPSSGDAVAVEFPATAAVLARMNARSGR